MKKVAIVLGVFAAMSMSLAVAQAETVIVKKHHPRCHTVIVKKGDMTKKIKHCRD